MSKSQFFEHYHPYIIGVIIASVCYRFGFVLPSDNAFFASSLTIGAILSGFMATSKAILMTLNTPVMERIRDTGYLDDLVSFLKSALWSGLFFSIFSLAGYFLDGIQESNKENIRFYYGLIWVFLGVVATLTFIRMTNIMLTILSYPPNR